MPFYHALVRPDLVPLEQREQFANDVVAIHCGVTGAPPSFVHVMFSQDSSGRLPEGQAGLVTGTIRAGRSAGQKSEIIERVGSALASAAGAAIETISVNLKDIQASYTMEGGALLPEPGSPEEEAWKTPV